VFGGHATGRLGPLGAQLSQVWPTALDERFAEAADLVARLNGAAYAIGVSAQRSVETEHAAHQGWGGGSR
jgi:hypothetical protein